MQAASKLCLISYHETKAGHTKLCIGLPGFVCLWWETRWGLMTEPLTATTLTGTAAATGLLAWWYGLDAGVVIGAFAGAVFFVLSSRDYSFMQKTGLFGVSFAGGVLSAGFAAKLMTAIVPGTTEAPEPLGALVAAALAVRLLVSLNTPEAVSRILSNAGSAIVGAISGASKKGGSDE